LLDGGMQIIRQGEVSNIVTEKKVLEMKHITKKFYALTALSDVSIDLYKGEVLGIVGENGAGKSTLMKILSGSYPANSYDGEVIVNGETQRFFITADAEKAGIEMIYQEISLMNDLSVAENILLGRLPQSRIKGFIDWGKVNQEARAALSYVGLELDINEMVRKLSTSQMQLLSIAKALYRKPKILVLDEPTSALTESETHRLMEIIESIKKQGISCIYISHKLDEVFNLTDRIIVLRDGNVISTYEKRDIVPDKVIEDMVGRKVENRYPKVHVSLGEEIFRVDNLTVPSNVIEKNRIENVSFMVRSGEILGLGGLVGSGRSELVNALFGGIRKTSGDIYIDSELVQIEKPADAIEHRIGLLTEDRRASGFVGTMNIRENISLASLEKISSKGFLNKKEEVRLTGEQFTALRVKAPGLETSILNLSGGNQQKVVLGKWLMSDVRILFLDEPTRGIDVGTKVELYNIMFKLAQKGVAIVMISSELPELMAVCDRFIVLCEGRVTGHFEHEDITEELFIKAATNYLC
jgi:ABC-type sugar transport system ATPase subunit